MSDETVKNKGGRPKIELDADMITRLAELQCSVREIAFVMGVSHDTIERNYKDAVELGKVQGKIKLRRAMFRNACENDNATMQVWLSKNILGYTDQPQSDENTMILPWEDEK